MRAGVLWAASASDGIVHAPADCLVGKVRTMVILSDTPVVLATGGAVGQVLGQCVVTMALM